MGASLLALAKSIYYENKRTMLIVTSGFEIISRESPDMMTGQIHFCLVTYYFWPVKFIR